MKNFKRLINALLAQYPEQTQLINEISNSAEYLRDTVSTAEDALTAIRAVDDTTAELWEILENEKFNNRDLTDMQYSIVITDIKQKAVELDSVIDDYRQDAINKYKLFIA